MSIKGYELNSDYERLWDLIKSHYRVPAVYDGEWRSVMHNGTHAFIDFARIEDKGAFIQICREKGLGFIAPNIDISNLKQISSKDIPGDIQEIIDEKLMDLLDKP